ncbi:CRISPR-associated protein, TM1812 family [Clostridium cochlearium]|uniref:CRISPR-associated protein, TM1812 family n=2 Tax=Clostridium cochlearium TaxID=1494 RepID=A0ABY0QP23_CLOCO|nr:TIGR02221 family CRISPR-associated protein [Clostridium cochlearium]SDL41694.1 CRISPR-associated protein, TM1812 family [Clostridium cochlearium]
MARKFLSVLGTSNYKDCYYHYENWESIYTNFIQEALIKNACKDWTCDDEIIIFLTDKARSENWFNKENEKRRLKERLEKFNIKVRDVDIPNAKNTEEIWSVFDIILESIQDNDEIIFDITHSFRSIPMLVLVVLNYAKVLKNIDINAIYYGAYEGRVKENDKEIAPIINLTAFNQLLEWSQAFNSFLEYGNSQQINKLAKKVLKSKLRNKDKEAFMIRDFVDRLNEFTNCIYTCRGKISNDNKSNNKNSIGIAYKNMSKFIDILVNKEDFEMEIRPLVPLFRKVKNRTEGFNQEDNLNTGLAVVKWSIDNNLTQQAYTALEETLKTYVCVRFNMDETDVEMREEVATKALRIKSMCISEDKWKVKKEHRDKIKYIVENLDDSIKKISGSVNKLRNDINHFGYSEDVSNYEKLNSNIKNLYEKLKETINKELEEE